VGAGDSGDDASTRAGISVDDDWHAWRVRWSPEGWLQFCKDGNPYFLLGPGSLPNWPFGPRGKPVFLLLNLAVGGDGGGDPGRTRFPVDMLVDYVRVW
jgi:hypothetical protein